MKSIVKILAIILMLFFTTNIHANTAQGVAPELNDLVISDVQQVALGAAFIAESSILWDSLFKVELDQNDANGFTLKFESDNGSKMKRGQAATCIKDGDCVEYSLKADALPNVGNVLGANEPNSLTTAFDASDITHDFSTAVTEATQDYVYQVKIAVTAQEIEDAFTGNYTDTITLTIADKPGA